MALLILTGLLLGALGLVLTGNYVENADESCLVRRGAKAGGRPFEIV